MSFCEFCSHYKITSVRFQDGICDIQNKDVKGYTRSCESYKDGFQDVSCKEDVAKRSKTV